MTPIWLNLLPVLIVVVFTLTSLLAGRVIEIMHFRRLDRKEAELRDIFIVNTACSDLLQYEAPCNVVHGEVVITSDAIKRIVGRIKHLLGGELSSFQTLQDRARREATVRMLEEARACGADAVINVRFAASSIGRMRGKGQTEMVEMYAYGTAVKLTNRQEVHG